MRVPKILISLLLLLISVSTRATDITFTEVNSVEGWNAAFDKAAEENKLVFVDVYTDWCTYCHKLDKEVYTEEAVTSYFNENFINLKFDAESEFGYQLARRYQVEGYPTLLFMTQSQEVFESIGGFVPAPTLLAYGKQTIQRFGILPDLEAKYKDLTISDDERLELIGLLEKVRPEAAMEVAKKHIDELTSDDYQDIETLWLVSRFENQMAGAPYQYISSHKDSIISWHGEEEYKDYLKAVYNDNLQLSIKYGDESLLEKLVTEVLSEFLAMPDVPEAAFVTRKIYYGQRQEYDKYIFAVRQYLANNVSNNSKEEFLFSTALEIVNEHEGLPMRNFAAELLSETVSMNEKNFEATSLLGYTNALLGNFQSADTQLKKAHGLAADDEERGLVDSLIEAVDLMKANN